MIYIKDKLINKSSQIDTISNNPIPIYSICIYEIKIEIGLVANKYQDSWYNFITYKI